jgi:hypothetical protein
MDSFNSPCATIEDDDSCSVVNAYIARIIDILISTTPIANVCFAESQE